jgi:hypothetical protein
MSRIFAIVMVALTVLLLLAGYMSAGGVTASASTPEAAVRSLFDRVRSHDLAGAYRYVAAASNVDQRAFARDLGGRDGSLRTYSQLQDVKTTVLHENDNDAVVHAATHWSSAVGALYDTRDLHVVKENGAWKVVWTAEKAQNAPPQVIPVNFLRWDIVRRSGDDDWGAQNVEEPHVRVVSMNAIESQTAAGIKGVVILGEIVNEDVVPAFVSVGAILYGKNGDTLGEESSFDKISHVLLPKEVSPYRIDFPGVRLADVKKANIQPNGLLVPASADPVIAVVHQRMEDGGRGQKLLKGELLNESGQIVNIPHVLATYYDDAGHVVWVADGYVDHALQPMVPQPFAVQVRDDLPANSRVRVTVNQYSIDRQAQ